jgi:vitamin B12 transporter
MKLIFLYILSIFLCNVSVSQISSSKDTTYYTEEINVISNRIETNIFWSPTSIKLIDKKQINSNNGERISDVLKSTGNIFMKSYGSNASLNTISLNGLGAEHTLILLDGKILNSFQNSQMDLSVIPKDKIEKIEIMNNGASSIYGSNAIGGVVNLITNNKDIDRPYIKLSASYGSYEQKKISTNFINKAGKLNYDLFYSYEKSKDNFKYYYDNGIVKIEKERENNSFSANNFYINLSYKISKKNELKYNSSYFSQTRNLPGIEAGTLPGLSEQKDNNWNNNLSYKHSFTNNIFLTSDLNFQNNLMKYKDIFSNDFYKNRIISNNTLINYKYKNIKNTTGYELLYADLKTGNYESTASRKQYSLFTASEFDINGIIKIFPSIRYDYISDINKNIVTGKFGINIKPFGKINLNLRSSVGNNFSAPTFNELYWINSGNKNLKPEKSINFDAGIIYRFNFMSDNTIELNYTRINLDDKIVWKPAEQGFWKPFNIDKSKSNVLSLDIKMKKNIAKDFQIGFIYNYTYNKSIKISEDYPGDPSYEKQIFYVPIELSKMNLDVSYKEFGLSLFYSFTGKRYSDFENLVRLPVIDLLDGNIYYTFEFAKIKLNTRIEVNNILDEDYQVIPGYPMPLRNFKFILSLTY